MLIAFLKSLKDSSPQLENDISPNLELVFPTRAKLATSNVKCA